MTRKGKHVRNKSINRNEYTKNKYLFLDCMM